VEELHRVGKKILILSNSGKRSQENVQRIAGLGLPPDTYDGVLTSGETAWRGLRDRYSAPFKSLGSRCLLITRGEDRSIIDGLPITLVDTPPDADFILLGGLDDAMASTEVWQSVFETAVARHLPLLCANPDLTMFGADGLIPAAGSLAARYAEMGGVVTYIGKPHPPIFAAALRQLGNPEPTRVVVIGDSLDHDILGGRQAGLLTVLITSGVHAGELHATADLPHAVSRLAADPNKEPHWIIEHLAW
jgi:HAD superfamily hydrolase (TIGR01459 family)